MNSRRMFAAMQILLIMALMLTGCAGQLAVEGQGGLDLGIGPDSGGEEGQGGSAQGGLTPLMIVLIVAAVFAIAATFLRSGPR